MGPKLHISAKSKLCTNLTLHRLPCKIHANDETDVKSFFKPKISTQNGKDILSATFRGRPLDGKRILLPEDYIGVVMKENKISFSDDDDRMFDMTGTFHSFIQWYLDSQHLAKSTIETVCKTWPSDISSAVHSPVQPMKQD